MKTRIIGLFLVVLLIAGLTTIAGCGEPQEQVAPQEQTAPQEQVDPEAPAALTGTITVGGSTSVYVVNALLAERFMAQHRDAVVAGHSVGSTAGIVGANEGTFDIGMSSRWLEGEELGWGLTVTTIAHDALSPVVHPDNPVTNLTMEQLNKIFVGEIRNWRDVGGSDMPITVVIREAGSGTRDAWEDIVHEDVDPHQTLIGKGTGGVKVTVAGDVSAIGYMTIAAVDETVRAVTIDGVVPDAAAVLAGDWGVARPFLFLTKGEHSPLQQAYIDWVLGPEGQQLLEDEGLVRVD